MSANYVSSLSGTEMDSAFNDLNNHTTLYGAEAWAKGTKGGVDVGSTDPTFHNNARYYAEVAQSAVPSENGAVLWNQSQNLSASEKSQARANIACGSSNRNLLDNGWFTINQRGQSSYSYPSQSGYTVDRWGIYDGTVTVNSGSITVATSNTCFFYQRIENYQKLYGKTITASVLDGDNVIHTGTIVASSSITNMIVASNFTLKFDPVDNGAITIFFSAGSLTLKAVKLELGSVSTLANDVAPDTASELAKCQRYLEYIEVFSGVIAGNSAVYITGAFKNIRKDASVYTVLFTQEPFWSSCATSNAHSSSISNASYNVADNKLMLGLATPYVGVADYTPIQSFWGLRIGLSADL